MKSTCFLKAFHILTYSLGTGTPVGRPLARLSSAGNLPPTSGQPIGLIVLPILIPVGAVHYYLSSHQFATLFIACSLPSRCYFSGVRSGMQAISFQQGAKGLVLHITNPGQHGTSCKPEQGVATPAGEGNLCRLGKATKDSPKRKQA